MSSELELLKQRITELEAENAELRKENTEIRDLRFKLSVSDAEIAELKHRNAETLRSNAEYNESRDAENAKLRARIEEMKSEFGDRIMKPYKKSVYCLYTVLPYQLYGLLFFILHNSILYTVRKIPLINNIKKYTVNIR